MEGLVPEETQERWRAKVAGAKFTMAEKMEAAQNRVREALIRTARDRQAAGLPGTPTRGEEADRG